jgi:hypothetical protein
MCCHVVNHNCNLSCCLSKKYTLNDSCTPIKVILSYISYEAFSVYLMHMIKVIRQWSSFSNMFEMDISLSAVKCIVIWVFIIKVFCP